MPRQRAHRTHSPYKPIENYGVIGDLETVALVGMDGSIDFMCFPEFGASPTIFGALLESQKRGKLQNRSIVGRHAAEAALLAGI